MTKQEWHVPRRVLISAANATIEAVGRCSDKWGEAEAAYCRRMCGESYSHIETDWIRDKITTLRKSGHLKSVLGGPKRKKKTEAQGRYAEYLKTEHWRAFRLKVLEFWSYKCCICKEAAKDVHHNCYARRYAEEITDCVALCRRCHTRVHGKMPDGNDIFNHGTEGQQV